MRAITIPLAVVLLAPVTGDAQVAIRPGQYELTIDMNLNLPTTSKATATRGTTAADAQKAVLDAAGFQGQKRLECITPDQAKEAQQDITKLYAREMAEANCKVADVKTVGNKVTFAMTCVEDRQRMVSNVEMTFGADWFTSTGTTTVGGRVSTMKTNARRVGECK
jgi:hypothetical protein